jgi:predicted nucleic acid-binding protein
MKVFIGLERAEKNEVGDFLESRFEIVPLNLLVAEQAIELRRTHRLRLPDAVILATADVNDAVLVTRNTKDFLPTMERVRVPYRL